MKIAILGDRHTLLGFSLAGVEGREPGEDPAATLEELMTDEDLGVLIITCGIAEILHKEIQFWKRERNFPIVVEIPEHGMEMSRDRINELLKRAVGMDIKT